MSGVMTPEQRSRAMSHIKGKDTSIEVLLRKALWHKGIRYRKNYKKLPGTPDIAITKYRIAIFCDSEFFHGYNWEIKKQKLGHNREYWIKKIERNMARDRENDFKLIAMGTHALLGAGDTKADRGMCGSCRRFNFRVADDAV